MCFSGNFASFLELGRQDYIVKSTTFKSWVFYTLYVFEITLYTIDMHKNRFLSSNNQPPHIQAYYCRLWYRPNKYKQRYQRRQLAVYHWVEMRYSRGHFRARWTLQIVFFSISIWQIYWTQRYIKAKKWRLIYITLLCWWIKEGEQYLTNISVEWALRRSIKKYNHIWEINLLIVEMYYSIKAIQHF